MLKLFTTPLDTLAAALVAGILLACLPAAAEPPLEPLVVDFDADSGKTIGKPGGALHMLVARPRDTRLMVVYGYARLVGYNEDLELVPDILKDVEVEDGRIFTFHLREGHKWSDGEPFTSEDFRYWWENVANNEALSPVGPPADLFVDGEPAKVEILDEHTVRYSWSKPNPFFLPLLAQATPQFIYMPAH
jgi:peptide/nickel transport system substrate-binding protein